MICFGFSIQQHTHAHPVTIIPVLHYLSQEIQAGERAFSRWLQISLTASQFYTSAKEKKSKLNWAGYVHPRASQNRGRHTKKRGGEFLGAQPDSQTHRKIKCRVKASSIRWVFHSDTWKLWSEAASLRRGKHFKSKKTKQPPPPKPRSSPCWTRSWVVVFINPALRSLFLLLIIYHTLYFPLSQFGPKTLCLCSSNLIHACWKSS